MWIEPPHIDADKAYPQNNRQEWDKDFLESGD